MAEPFLQRRLQRVVRRIGDSRYLAGRRILAVARLIGERAAGIEPPLIGIAGIRNWLAVHISGNEHGWVRFDKAGQACPLGADVSDLEKKIGPERLLQVDVPILRIRKFQRRRQSQVRQGLGVRPRDRGMPLYGSAKFGRLTCGVPKYGGALIGACKGPPCPV